MGSKRCDFVHVFLIVKRIIQKIRFQRLPYDLVRLQIHRRMFCWQTPLPQERTVLGMAFCIAAKEDRLTA